jgi:hypothetical protein
MAGGGREERAIELIASAGDSWDFGEYRGVTMDSGYPIEPVSALPAEPAVPPASPASGPATQGVDTVED